MSSTGTFGPASRSGNISGAMILSPNADCPGNQTLLATYTGVTLTLVDTGETSAIEGPIFCSER